MKRKLGIRAKNIVERYNLTKEIVRQSDDAALLEYRNLGAATLKELRSWAADGETVIDSGLVSYHIVSRLGYGMLTDYNSMVTENANDETANSIKRNLAFSILETYNFLAAAGQLETLDEITLCETETLVMAAIRELVDQRWETFSPIPDNFNETLESLVRKRENAKDKTVCLRWDRMGYIEAWEAGNRKNGLLFQDSQDRETVLDVLNEDQLDQLDNGYIVKLSNQQKRSLFGLRFAV